MDTYQSIIDKLILPTTTVLTLLSLIIGIWITVAQYRLKVKEEVRLNESTKAEYHIKLLNLFTSTLEIAHSRKGAMVSEKVIENLLSKNISVDEIKGKGLAEIAINYGISSQIAAIVSFGELGSAYTELKHPALNALKSLNEQFGQNNNQHGRQLTPLSYYIEEAFKKINV